MKGLIYIAGSFETVNRSKCGRGLLWIDNDPHFWTSPATWGICRNDLRRSANIGDYVIFVLPKNAKQSQMIFGYMKIDAIISHLEAYHREDLVDKRMGNKNPNGNIIVDSAGNYNRYDAGVHKKIFDKIKERYVIGNCELSKFLTSNEIRNLAPGFCSLLSSVFDKEGNQPIDFISRKGAVLDEEQVHQVIDWINGQQVDSL